MILERIVADNAAELTARQRAVPLSEIRRKAENQPAPRSLAAALRGERLRLIAEVKKASPSRGLIRADFDPVDIARTYAENGAAAISVLTEPHYFQGRLDYLQNIREALGETSPPLLRKDFIYDPYQVYEARAFRADSILLIVAMLAPEQLSELLSLSRELGMDCLVEVHDEPEMEIALKSGARIIGINNRDLKTFRVDTATTARLRPLVPEDRVVVSESGIKNRADIERLRELGVDAVLIGEALTSAPDIATRMKEFI
ncbi:MAG: indole-3-glycerol phosphate synthase TrpC [Chloroflexota bacterium]